MLGGFLLFAGCSGTPCRAQSDCPTGTRCETGGENEGVCIRDCDSPDDCSVEDVATQVARCDNLGRCQIAARPPRLRVLAPENDTLLPEGTRSLQISGDVETAGARVEVEVFAAGRPGCPAGDERRVTLLNPDLGKAVQLAFVVPDLELDTGLSILQIKASVNGATDRVEHLLEIPCPGCATIAIEEPAPSLSPGLVLPRLSGRVTPTSVRAIVWRVKGAMGDVFDGIAAVTADGRFVVDRVPIFAGTNRLQVIVTGVGSGPGESRCSASITSAVASERGLRALLTWDGPTSDLDVHLIGPAGRYGDPSGELSSRSQSPSFGGRVTDDFEGFGPEELSAEVLPDGVYGVIVEPVFDDRDAGANAILRMLFDGRAILEAPVGPAFLSSEVGELWIAGTIEVVGGAANWRLLDDRVPVAMPPTRPPREWPTYY